MIRESEERFSQPYLKLCRRQRRIINVLISPKPGDWLLGSTGLSLTGDSPGPVAEDEVVVPRLDQLIRLLNQHADRVIISFSGGDAVCQAMDGFGQPLANIISRSPEEAAFRALIFILVERSVNEPGD
jgi:hypothetical protein